MRLAPLRSPAPNTTLTPVIVRRVAIDPPPAVSREDAGTALLAALQAEDPDEAERHLLAFLGPDGDSAYAGRGELMDILLRTPRPLL